MSSLPSLHAMNRGYEHICILPMLIYKYDWKTHALDYHNRVDNEATTTTVQFVEYQGIFQIS